MGWREGTGLGVKNDGRTEPVQPSRRSKQSEGIGLKNKPADDQWWKKLMVDAYGPPTQPDSVDLLAACEGRRCRPHGKAKLARLDAHDQAAKLASHSSNGVDEGQLVPEASISPSANTAKKLRKRSKKLKKSKGGDNLHVEPQIRKKKIKKSKR